MVRRKEWGGSVDPEVVVSSRFVGLARDSSEKCVQTSNDYSLSIPDLPFCLTRKGRPVSSTQPEVSALGVEHPHMRAVGQ